MAIDWVSIKSLIKTQISRASRINSSAVRWVDEQSGPLAGVQPVIYLRAAPIVAIGTEEERRDDNGTNDQTVNLAGQREFTLTVRCESWTPDPIDDAFAGNILERVKMLFSAWSYSDERLGVFGVKDYGPTRWFDYEKQGRVISTYVTEIVCVTVNNEIDDTIGAGDYIGEVFTHGTVNNSSGTPLVTVDQDIK